MPTYHVMDKIADIVLDKLGIKYNEINPDHGMEKIVKTQKDLSRRGIVLSLYLFVENCVGFTTTISHL